jgi:hypothetical protein
MPAWQVWQRKLGRKPVKSAALAPHKIRSRLCGLSLELPVLDDSGKSVWVANFADFVLSFLGWRPLSRASALQMAKLRTR